MRMTINEFLLLLRHARSMIFAGTGGTWLLISGCAGNAGNPLPVFSDPESFRYFEYEGSSVVRSSNVIKGSTEYEKLMTNVKKRRDGWVRDLNTYSPGLYFISNDLQINCRDDVVVINVRSYGGTTMSEWTSAYPRCRTDLLSAK